MRLASRPSRLTVSVGALTQQTMNEIQRGSAGVGTGPLQLSVTAGHNGMLRKKDWLRFYLRSQNFRTRIDVASNKFGKKGATLTRRSRGSDIRCRALFQ